MRAYVRVPLRDRLEEKVIPVPWSGCWIWMGAVRSNADYGSIRSDEPKQRQISAHRAAYETYIGPIPSKMLVCHHCDNPLCVNPSHLFLGSHQENMKDRNAKGRQARQRGELQGGAKLTWGMVRVIRETPIKRGSGRQLARFLGVSEATVSNVRHGLRWNVVAP